MIFIELVDFFYYSYEDVFDKYFTKYINDK